MSFADTFRAFGNLGRAPSNGYGQQWMPGGPSLGFGGPFGGSFGGAQPAQQQPSGLAALLGQGGAAGGYGQGSGYGQGNGYGVGQGAVLAPLGSTFTPPGQDYAAAFGRLTDNFGSLVGRINRNSTDNTLANMVGYEPFGGGGWGSG